MVEKVGAPVLIRTPDQKLRVFVSSTLRELAPEREAARAAIARLRLAPVLFELGARPHPARELYRAYLEQSHIFVGIYWESYGWVAPGESVSGLEDEYLLSGDRPKLIYVKSPAPGRQERLTGLLNRIRSDDTVSYKGFSTAAQLRRLLEDDLMLLLTERFEMAEARPVVETAPERRPDNLPTPPTPLVGREREAAAVQALLRRPEVRLVTLGGPGGVGKSRLAIEVASRVREDFEGGVWFVALASLRDPNLVVGAIAQAIGLKEVEGMPSVENLVQYLRDRHILLVLDNFEQVMDAVPLVSELLAAAPNLKVVATSREVLRISGEYEYPVPPLSLPDVDVMGARMTALRNATERPASDERFNSRNRVRRGIESPAAADGVSTLMHYDAVRLFVERARAARPGFTLTQENATAVVEIARRLDGLPLAIELAAARSRLLTPEAILARLQHSLGLLTVGPRDLPARQQTLRGAIDWSYGLLDESEQRLFRMLGAFAHGWTLEAVEAVYGDDEEGFVLEGLSSLIDKSLAQQDEGDGEPRFTMLETIRQFAIEQLEQSAECQEVRDRHATYFLSLAETAAPELRGARQLDWLRRLEQENLNLQTALNGLVDKGDTETAVRLAWALWFFWWTHGHQNTVPPWLDAITTTSDTLPVAIRAKAVAVAATIRIRQGDHERASPLCDQALALFRELGDHDGEALALGGQGMVCMYRHNLGAATARFEEALALYRELGNKWGIAIMLGYIGRIAALQGDVELVSGALEESIATLLELGDKTTAVFTLNTLAMSALLDKNPFRAIGLLTYGLKLSEEVGSRGNAVYCLEGLAAVAADQGKYERAARLWGASEALREALRAPMAPNDRAFCEPFIEAARTHTDHAVFTAAWAEGRKLSLDQAVEYALEEGEYL